MEASRELVARALPPDSDAGDITAGEIVVAGVEEREEEAEGEGGEGSSGGPSLMFNVE